MADGIFDPGIFDPGIFDTSEGVNRTASDTVALSDAVGRTATLARSLSDSPSISESVSAVVTPPGGGVRIQVIIIG